MPAIDKIRSFHNSYRVKSKPMRCPLLSLLPFVLLCITAGLSLHCSTTGKVASTEDTDQREYVTLLDRLRKVPGLNISGSENDARIIVRGHNTLQGESQPLFVVNGQPMGHQYAAVASHVHVFDIQSIRVLSGSEAARYGARGGSGVIEIRTK